MKKMAAQVTFCLVLNFFSVWPAIWCLKIGTFVLIMVLLTYLLYPCSCLSANLDRFLSRERFGLRFVIIQLDALDILRFRKLCTIRNHNEIYNWLLLFETPNGEPIKDGRPTKQEPLHVAQHCSVFIITLRHVLR